LKQPITLAVVMTALLAVLTVGLILLAVFGALADASSAGFYWTFLTIGTTFSLLLLVGVVLYLALSVKAINLNRRQSNFIDSVTHELKSPIASMKLYLQTLACRAVSAEERNRFYKFILEDLDRLDYLINQVLDAGRVDSHRLDREEEDVQLIPLLEECIRIVCMRHAVPPDAITLDVEPCSVRAGPADLQIVFRNLLDNAIKYGSNPPEVEVSTRSCTKHVAVTIRDNGQGIPRKHRRKIFGRFVRLGSELERKKTGTGLGLYIVGMLVRRLGGRIAVQSGDFEVGSIFEVRLPRSRVVSSDPGAARTAESAGAEPPEGT